LCGYDLGLGNDIVTELASLHTAESSREVAFHVVGCADDAIGLAGQFDRVAVAALGRVLARLRAGADAGALVIDIAAVDYVDHRLLLALSDYVRSHGVEVPVRAIPPFAARLMDLLPASYLRLAVVGAES
jgi:anti-anti-sigma regulatory factor